ncbi:MAG: putative metal-binding motif-containing protein, partial [Deltaproteobacteria bacterium]|nr:putative metal-binding motif-containing protein [Deltaproteobacteria bacterium]
MRLLPLLALSLFACRETGETKYVTDRDEDGIVEEDDCNDEDASVGTPQTYYADYDRDGHGDAAVSDSYCERPAGYAETGDDCDDNDAEVYPGAGEVCDGKDNDCDGTIDNGTGSNVYYADVDQDGYGDDASIVYDCSTPEGYAAVGGDCNDADAAYNPGALEEDCEDPEDYNCDGSVGYADNDGDGFAACTECDDSSASVFPGADEYCNEVDDDCDGEVDESDAVDTTTWYADLDGDGYGDDTNTTTACDAPSGYVADYTDCDDTSADVSPAETEVCNGIDDNCDGSVDEATAGDAATWYADADSDGYGTPDTTTVSCDAPSGYVGDDTDCDDGAPAVNPAATEYCDGIDNNCDGAIDEDAAIDAATWYADADGDGYGDATTVAVDCEQPSGYVADRTDCDDTDTGTASGTPRGPDFTYVVETLEVANSGDGLDLDGDGTSDNLLSVIKSSLDDSIVDAMATTTSVIIVQMWNVDDWCEDPDVYGGILGATDTDGNAA